MQQKRIQKLLALLAYNCCCAFFSFFEREFENFIQNLFFKITTQKIQFIEIRKLLFICIHGFDNLHLLTALF